MDREIALPFRVDSQGHINTVTDPTATARQHLTTYLLTSPGERVMRPRFGTPIRDYTFENLDPVVMAVLRERTARAVDRDVTDVTLEGLSVREDSDQSAMRIAVEFAVVQGLTGTQSIQSTTLELRGGEL